MGKRNDLVYTDHLIIDIYKSTCIYIILQYLSNCHNTVNFKLNTNLSIHF